MRATLLNTGASDGRAVAADGAIAAVCAAAGATIAAPANGPVETLAVEWARFGVRATAVVPGPRATDDELGPLVAFLASAGGEYFSGCRFSLR